MIRARRSVDGGFSLAEMIVVMILFALLLSLAFSLMIQLTFQAKDGLAQARAVEQARLGISQIDRQVRSGNLIKDPQYDDDTVSGVPPYFSMRIYTQVDDVERCAQWRVYDADGDVDDAGYTAGDLQFRTWDPAWPAAGADVTPWYIVAQDTVLIDTSVSPDPDDPLTWPPFWVDTSLPTGGEAQNIRITLRILDPDSRATAKPITVSSVITGRNTVYGYDSDYCDSVPPY